MTRHTPGPWYPTYSEVGEDYGITTPSYFVGAAHREADARLMAAASDLLSALRLLIWYAEDGESWVLEAAKHQAYAAMAKAELPDDGVKRSDPCPTYPSGECCPDAYPAWGVGSGARGVSSGHSGALSTPGSSCLTTRSGRFLRLQRALAASGCREAGGPGTALSGRPRRSWTRLEDRRRSVATHGAPPERWGKRSRTIAARP
jgi:hypothetical protein